MKTDEETEDSASYRQTYEPTRPSDVTLQLPQPPQPSRSVTVCVFVCVCLCVCVCVCVCVQTHNEKRESKLVFMVLSARKRGTECKNDQIWKSFQVSSRRHLLVFRTMNLIYHASFYIIWAWRLTHECTLPWSLQMHFLLYTLRKSLEYATIKRVCTSNLRFYFYVL